MKLTSTQGKFVDISELSKKTGLASSKIRYYEKIGIIKSNGRSGLKRTFGDDILYILSFIKLSQSCGFSLEEIRNMLTKNKKLNMDHDMINNKIDEINNKITELKKMITTLNHLNNCPKDYHFDCSNFRKILKSI